MERADGRPPAADIAVTDPRDPAARRCLQAYFTELARRFDDGFDPAQSIPADNAELTLPAGLLLVATVAGDPAGCGALKFHLGDGVAEVKRMWVSPAVRGLGLGRRLLGELEAQAARHGARLLRLETNRNLTEAIAMYRAAGYREVPAFNDEAYAHHWFEKPLPRRHRPLRTGDCLGEGCGRCRSVADGGERAPIIRPGFTAITLRVNRAERGLA